MIRSITPRQLAFDVVLAGACLLLRLLLAVDFRFDVAFVVATMAAALGLRRVSPVLALSIAWLGALVQMGAGLEPDAANLAILPVLYASAAYGRQRVKWAGLISAGVGALLAAGYIALYPFFGFRQFSVSQVVADGGLSHFFLSFAFLFGGLLAAFGLSWTLGLLTRTRRTARESRIAQLTAEQDETRARQVIVVEQERNRIARDMHDVVAHSLAVVIAQADGARYAQESDPGATAAALTTISTTAREALGDVRILLSQLRHNQGESPQPVLADLDRLLEQFRASGLSIDVSENGTEISLGTGQQLAIYRIVQEALTNALRHGDPGEGVTVHFDWSAVGLEVSISSALLADPTPDAGSGHGIVGMRERASLVGGWLTAEPALGRFTVTAGIPKEVGASEA